MRKSLTLISFILLFIVFAPKQIKAQVVTFIGNYEMCYNAYTSIPVTVQNMDGVDAFRLVLVFDPAVVEYIENFAVNSALSGGTFSVTNAIDSIIISWSHTTTTSISHDTLVWLRFKGLTGSTALHWNESSSYYHTPSGNTLSLFNNGSSVVDPKINVLLTEIDPTCEALCDANYQANASGGTAPYIYQWDGKPGRFDSIQTGLCAGLKNITITDSKGCKLDSTYTITGLPGADVTLVIKNSDDSNNEDSAIYVQNPFLKFSFQENFPTHVVEPPVWFFGDGDSAVSFNPTHVYSRVISNTDGYYDLKMIIKNENGCESTITTRLIIKEVKLKIPGVITPNGDSFNESFLIMNENKTGSGEDIKITTEFQRMEIVIFDRWGRKIYNDSNYKSDWHADGVSDGAYYYKLTTIGYYKTDTYKGSITILGSSNSQ
jgi:hypothetical protein